jgi:hypothetical protein
MEGSQGLKWKPFYTLSGGKLNMKIDNWTFGFTMVVVGMGGTLLTLWILGFCMNILKKFFPYKKEEEGN